MIDSLLRLMIQYKWLIQGGTILIIVTYGGDWLLKKKFGFDLQWFLKDKIGSRMYPVRIIALQKLAGKSWMISQDREKRIIRDNKEMMQGLRNKTQMSPIDYSNYILDKDGHKWMLALDYDKEARVPLRPLTYSDIFVYDNLGKIVKDDNGNPLMREDFIQDADSSEMDTTIGLRALSKDRKRWLVQGIKEDAIKHQEKDDHKIILGAIGFILILAVVALAIYFNAVPEAATKAAQATVP